MGAQPQKFSLWVNVDGRFRQVGRIAPAAVIRAKAAALVGAAAAVGKSVNVEVRPHVPVPRRRLDRAEEVDSSGAVGCSGVIR